MGKWNALGGIVVGAGRLAEMSNQNSESVIFKLPLLASRSV